MGIGKKPRGRRGGAHTRKRITVHTSRRLNKTCTRSVTQSNLVPIPRQGQTCPALPSFFLTNTQSMNNKFEDFECVIKQNEADVVAVCETWFKNLPDDISLVGGYRCYRNDRYHAKKTKGGGVAVFVREYIKSELASDIRVPSELEVIWIKITVPTYKFDIYIGCVYFPCKCKLETQLQEHLVNTIDSLRSEKNASIIILGDFNEFDTSLVECHANMSQLVTFPTRKDAILDKIVTDIHSFYQDPVKLPAIGKSDHCCVVLHPNKQVQKPKAVRSYVRPITDSSIRSFGQWITLEKWEAIYAVESADEKASVLEELLLEKFHTHFPEKCVKQREDDKPWLTESIKRLINQPQKAYYMCGNMDIYKQ